MELPNLIFEIIHLKLVKHYYVMVSVLSQEALEANRAQVIFAESFDVFVTMDFAF
jgi:hypothetical protein